VATARRKDATWTLVGLHGRRSPAADGGQPSGDLGLVQEGPMKISKILVPIDYSSCSDQALQWGAGLAEKFGVQLLLLHVIPRPSQDLPGIEDAAPRLLALETFVCYVPSVPEGMIAIDPIDMAQNELRDLAAARLNEGVSIVPKVGVGRPAEEIVRVARDERVDLIVMGTHGRTGVRHLLAGSVAEAVMRTPPCPVFTVKAAPELPA
jgi:universal stress protein A